MRKAAGAVAAAAVAFGSMVFTAPSAIAAPQGPQETAAAPAKCVKVVRFYSKRFNRLVEVENTCARKACFSVTVAARRDPEFAIGANKKESFRYGGTLWTQGTGIKNIGC
ncbi:hypothetical protein [Streptomyces sp. NPDC005805]|uniref:hypothetical protein n=1 Tax=Streptomyces sp. NPDC005805 TaxID=3157068 RepID=UPI0033E7CAF2